MPFAKASPAQAAVKIAMYGPSGSGKTFSSLLFAEGLAKLSGKRVAMIDTERGTDYYAQAVPNRQVHPEEFDFDAIYTNSITTALKEIRSIDPGTHSVLVIDSLTHLWESCINSYSGKLTKAGTIPIYAWTGIKKPFKELMNLTLSLSLHVIYCGRQGNEYEEQDGEVKVAGHKMKAEGETQYEPHILIRMEHGKKCVQAVVEKDRTGTITNMMFANPGFDDVISPMVPLLGDTQAVIDREADAINDAGAIAEEKVIKEKVSKRLAARFAEDISIATTTVDLKEIGKKINSQVKKEMSAQDLAEVRKVYQNKLSTFESAGV